MAKEDPLALDIGIQHTKDNADDVTVQMVDTGHWMQLETPEDLNNTIREFIHKKMGL